MDLGIDSFGVIVTGASRGLGAAITMALVAEGANVIAAARSTEDLASLAALASSAPGRIEPVSCDMRDTDAVEALVDACLDRFARVDAVVNNAGIAPSGKLVDTDLAVMEETLAVNVIAPAALSRSAARYWIASETPGAIVNIASGAVVDPHVGLSPYGASKAAVVHLTRTAALECAADGIRVNVILPGRTRTAMLEEYYKLTPGAEEAAVAQAPLGRIGLPSETANAIVWLCSDCSSYVDGVSLLVDGGQHAGRSF